MPTLKGPKKTHKKSRFRNLNMSTRQGRKKLYQYHASHAAPSNGPLHTPKILLASRRLVAFSQTCWLLPDALISPNWDSFGGCFLSSPKSTFRKKLFGRSEQQSSNFFESEKVPFKSYPFLNWNFRGSQREIKMNINYDIGSVGMVYLPTWMA